MSEEDYNPVEVDELYHYSQHCFYCTPYHKHKESLVFIANKLDVTTDQIIKEVNTCRFFDNRKGCYRILMYKTPIIEEFGQLDFAGSQGIVQIIHHYIGLKQFFHKTCKKRITDQLLRNSIQISGKLQSGKR